MTKENHVEAVCPTDRKWIVLAENMVRTYAVTEGFNTLLADMLADSVNEACGTLCERAAAIGVDSEYRLRLETHADAITIAITYDGTIPLNPMKEKPYKVPDNPEELSAFEVDSLWLHLIKYRMDRVSFSIDGKRQTLHLMKYRRSEGKEKEVWIMSRQPQLVPDLIIDDGGMADASQKMVGFVQNPKQGKVVRLGRTELDAVRQMDGNTSIYDIYLQAVEKGLTTSPQLYIALYETLETNKMLCHDREADKIPLWKRWKERLTRNYLSIPHPDKAVERFHHAVRFFFTPAGLAFILLAGLSGFLPLYLSSGIIRETYIHSFDTLYRHWWMLPVMYVLLLASTVLHELSHGAAWCPGWASCSTSRPSSSSATSPPPTISPGNGSASWCRWQVPSALSSFGPYHSGCFTSRNRSSGGCSGWSSPSVRLSG